MLEKSNTTRYGLYCLVAVSYTHLDVYKRQAELQTQHDDALAVVKDLDARMVSLLSLIHISENISYHVAAGKIGKDLLHEIMTAIMEDVYKRQRYHYDGTQGIVGITSERGILGCLC